MSEQFKYEKQHNPVKDINDPNKAGMKQKDDSDLIIEENTIYEIDRECYERLRRLRRRKTQDRKNI